MYKVKNVTKKFGNSIALDDVSFELPEVGFIVIKGANGSGKSTLLALLGAIDTIDAGTITLGETNLGNLSSKERARLRETTIDFIFQDGNLFDNLTVRENINIVGTSSRFQNTVNFLGLAELLDKKPKELSGGERQKVGIARALMKNSRVLLADEPTSALDDSTKESIFKLLARLSTNHLVIMITHDQHLADKYGNMFLTLDDGHLVDVTIRATNDTRSDVPLHHNCFSALKFSLKNLFQNKSKAIRNTSVMVLTLLCVLITTTIFSLDFEKMHTATLKREGQRLVELASYTKDDTYDPFRGEFTFKDIRTITDTLGPDIPLVTGRTLTDENDSNLGILSMPQNESGNLYYYMGAPSFLSIDKLDKVMLGRKPENVNEIVVTSYLAETMLALGYMTRTSGYYTPTSIEELLTNGKPLAVGRFDLKVVGIVDVDTSAYAYLKDIPSSQYDAHKMEVQGFIKYLRYEALDIYVLDDFFTNQPKFINSNYTFHIENVADEDPKISLATEPITLDSGNEVTLEDGEIIVNSETLVALGFDPTTITEEKIDLLIQKYGEPVRELGGLSVRGISADDRTYLTPATLEPYLTSYRTTYSKVMLDCSDDATLKRITREYHLDRGTYRLTSAYSEFFLDAKPIARKISIAGLAISIIFGILSFFFLLNYVKGSISLRRKEIATLRCLGVKDSAIARIFAIEGVALSLLSYLISFGLFLLVRIIVNNYLFDLLALRVDILPIVPTLLFVVIVVLVLVSYLLSWTSVHRISKIEPKIVFQNETL